MNNSSVSSQRDFFSEIRDRERKRFEEALREAREVVLRNHFSSPESAKNVEEIRNFEDLLANLEGMALMFIDSFCRHLPSPLHQIRGRSSWEVYLSGLRFLVRRYPKGFLRKTVLSLKEWEGFPEKVDAYSAKCLSGFIDFSAFTREVEKYCLNYNKARKIAEQYKIGEDKERNLETPEGTDYGNLCRLYASLVSWERAEEFNHLNQCLSKAQTQLFEIIIEGPVQLYLLIGEDTLFFILRIATIERLGDFFFDKDRKDLQDLKDFHELTFKIVEGSKKYETFEALIKEASKVYVEGFLRTQKRLRSQYPTEELRRRFVSRFERGEIFRSD